MTILELENEIKLLKDRVQELENKLDIAPVASVNETEAIDLSIDEIGQMNVILSWKTNTDIINNTLEITSDGVTVRYNGNDKGAIINSLMPGKEYKIQRFAYYRNGSFGKSAIYTVTL